MKPANKLVFLILIFFTSVSITFSYATSKLEDVRVHDPIPVEEYTPKVLQTNALKPMVSMSIVQESAQVLKSYPKAISELNVSDTWKQLIYDKRNTVSVKYCNTFDSRLNIRQEPNTNSKILGKFRYNDKIQVVTIHDNWACIKYNGNYAFVSADYITDEQSEIYSTTDKNSDLYILAHIICGEAQSAPDQEQLYVGSVFLNRVKDSRFPNTFSGVAFQKNQYSCTNDGNYYRTPTDRNWANAKWLLENGSVLPDYVIFQSQNPLGKVYIKTKYHYYCYK